MTTKIKRQYVTTESQRQYMKQYFSEHKEEKKEYDKQYNLTHKKERKELREKYKLEHPNYKKEYYLKNKEKISQYGKDNRDRIREYNKQRQIIKREFFLLSCYRQQDKRKNRICDLTSDWIKENIISKPCVYCGEKTEYIGCDRINNKKGHTKDNVLPCCEICNYVRMNRFTIKEMYKLGAVIKQIKEDRKVLKQVF